MTTGEILNKIAEALPEADVREYRGIPIFKIYGRTYYLKPRGNKYILGRILPMWLRLSLMIIFYVASFYFFKDIYPNPSSLVMTWGPVIATIVLYFIAVLLIVKFSASPQENKMLRTLNTQFSNSVIRAKII